MTRPSAHVRAVAVALLLCALSPGLAAAEPQALPADLIAKAERPAPYPHFADVPPIPTDVRTVPEWRQAVVETRLAGRRTERAAEAGPWTLDETEAFADRARAEANPPAPVTAASQPADEALIRALKARAIPPPRRR